MQTGIIFAIQNNFCFEDYSILVFAILSSSQDSQWWRWWWWWWWWWWWCLVFVVLLTDKRCLALFLPGTIDKDPYHRKSSTRREKDLCLRTTWVQWSCAVLITTTPRCHKCCLTLWQLQSTNAVKAYENCRGNIGHWHEDTKTFRHELQEEL